MKATISGDQCAISLDNLAREEVSDAANSDGLSLLAIAALEQTQSPGCPPSLTPSSETDSLSAQNSPASQSTSKRRLSSGSGDNLVKDEHYWEKRRKNNEAARRSREKRRQNDVVMEQCIRDLSKENSQLRQKLETVAMPLSTPCVPLIDPPTPVTPSEPMESAALSARPAPDLIPTAPRLSAFHRVSHSPTPPVPFPHHDGNLMNNYLSALSLPIGPPLNRPANMDHRLIGRAPDHVMNPFSLPLHALLNSLPSSTPPHGGVPPALRHPGLLACLSAVTPPITLPRNQLNISQEPSPLDAKRQSPDTTTSCGSEECATAPTPNAGKRYLRQKLLERQNRCRRVSNPGVKFEAQSHMVVPDASVSQGPIPLANPITTQSLGPTVTTVPDSTLLKRCLSNASSDLNCHDSLHEEDFTLDKFDMQSDRYLERRRRNNEAAKRCRANRRALFEYRYRRAQELEDANQALKKEMLTLKEELERLRRLVARKNGGVLADGEGSDSGTESEFSGSPGTDQKQSDPVSPMTDPLTPSRLSLPHDQINGDLSHTRSSEGSHKENNEMYVNDS